jgi:hypothetical protein
MSNIERWEALRARVARLRAGTEDIRADADRRAIEGPLPQQRIERAAAPALIFKRHDPHQTNLSVSAAFPSDDELLATPPPAEAVAMAMAAQARELRREWQRKTAKLQRRVENLETRIDVLLTLLDGSSRTKVIDLPAWPAKRAAS